MSIQRSIPSLDGLRAVAIMLVIACHVQASFPSVLPLIFIERCGSVGVDMFFVISGYLITHLLLKEVDKTGQVRLGRFYIRRAFRIFPPFYAYLAVVAIMRCLHPVLFTWGSFASAATYLWNYNMHADGWLLGHTWSLSLEEQFYLVWPAIVAFLPKRSGLKFALIVIALSPVVRVATYFLFPPLRGHIDMMLPTHLDTMMVGCALALTSNLKVYTKFLSACAKPVWVAMSGLLLVVVTPVLEEHFRGAFYLPLGITITSFACGCILLYSIRNASSLLGRFLNLPWLRHIGVISYSLYLWQQLFTGPQTRLFPLNIVLIVLCAELSYWLVEQPSFRLRDYLAERRVQRKSLVSQSGLVSDGVN
jgi:peptidoglycan/LPS O-acetylase OafA/YrhL